jgi:hypothetical protein
MRPSIRRRKNGASGQGTSVTLTWMAANWFQPVRHLTSEHHPNAAARRLEPGARTSEHRSCSRHYTIKQLQGGTTYLLEDRRQDLGVTRPHLDRRGALRPPAAVAGGGSTPFSGTPVARSRYVRSPRNFDNGGSTSPTTTRAPATKGARIAAYVDVDLAATADAGGGIQRRVDQVGEWLKYNDQRDGRRHLHLRQRAWQPSGRRWQVPRRSRRCRHRPDSCPCPIPAAGMCIRRSLLLGICVHGPVSTWFAW